ncbi:MAG: PIG-L family deacetylase [Actinomycetota bacterium]|nr:PIG-L family deacetylase [Actinomycetota bacterium]
MPDTILVVAAHPDDIDFGAAGTIASWTDAGARVAYCIVTDGDSGGFDRSQSRADLARIRRSEQEAAAKVVGVDEVLFLGYPDGRLTASLELRRDLSRVIRTIRPGRVMGPTPERNWQSIYASHPDHLACGEAMMAAVYPDSRNPFAHPELLADGLEPHVVPEVWLQASPRPNHGEEVTEQFARKMEALRCHVSQHPEPDQLDERMQAWGAWVAATFGLADGRMAEAFQIVATA